MPAAASACCARRCCVRFRAPITPGSNTANTCASASAGRRARSRTGARIRSTSWSATTCCSTSMTAPRRAPSRTSADSRAASCISRRSRRATGSENCDRSRTDREVHLRDAEWYGARLRRHFRPSGAGFWIRRGAPLVHVGNGNRRNLNAARYARAACREPVLPVDAASGDARHRDVRAQVFAAVPQRRAPAGQAPLLAPGAVPRAVSRRA